MKPEQKETVKVFCSCCVKIYSTSHSYTKMQILLLLFFMVVHTWQSQGACAKPGCLCTKQARAIASKLLGQIGGFTCQIASQRDSDDEEQAKEGLITAWLAGYSCITWENVKYHLRHGVGREDGKKAADEVEETCINSWLPLLLHCLSTTTQRKKVVLSMGLE